MKLKDFFISSENNDFVMKYLNDIVKLGIEFKTDNNLISRMDTEEIKTKFLSKIPNEAVDFQELYKKLSEITRLSTNFSSKKFMAFPDAGNAISSVASAILIPLINQNLINADHCSPVGTFVEIAVINWLREILGYTTEYNPKNIMDVGGIITSGGTISNTIALMTARDKMFPRAKNEGIGVYDDKIIILVPKYISHYSQRCSMAWLGLGEKNAIEVEITDDLQLDLDDLRSKIEYYKKDHKIMAIVCYAGDSRAMALDNFEEIAKIAKENDTWFHVDACHGFQLGFSENLKDMIKGIEKADSITMDPHKVLAIPYVISGLAFKNPSDFSYIASNSDLIMKEDYAFGQITPMLGSRAFNSLKLWSFITSLGKNNIGKMIEKRRNLACYVFDKLIKDKNFIVVNKKVGINSVLFLYNPDEEKDLKSINIDFINNLNKEIYKRIFDENKCYLHNFPFPDIRHQFGENISILYPLRFMCGNILTSESDVDQMILTIKDIAIEVLKDLKHG